MYLDGSCPGAVGGGWDGRRPHKDGDQSEAKNSSQHFDRLTEEN